MLIRLSSPYGNINTRAFNSSIETSGKLPRYRTHCILTISPFAFLYGKMVVVCEGEEGAIVKNGSIGAEEEGGEREGEMRW